jgi:hypothetical protein
LPAVVVRGDKIIGPLAATDILASGRAVILNFIRIDVDLLKLASYHPPAKGSKRDASGVIGSKCPDYVACSGRTDRRTQ